MMEVLIGSIASLVVMILMFLLRSINSRITELERHTMHKREIRELIEDKIGGIREDVSEIKQRINELLDLMVRQNNKGG